jgi:hypothetical protein
MHSISQTETAQAATERIKQTVLAQVLQNLRQVRGRHIQPTRDITVQHRLANGLSCDINQGLNGVLAGAGQDHISLH